MRAIRHALAYRDFKAAPELCPGTPPDPAVVMRWRARLGEVDLLDEREALPLLADFGVPVVNARIAESEPQTLAAALGIGYPVALKTAAPGITHKTDRAGVSLGLEDEDALRRAYRDLSSRLGSRVNVSAMAPAGAEVALGVVRDPDFGPLVMIGTGGVLVELLEDTRFALPPTGGAFAGR